MPFGSRVQLPGPWNSCFTAGRLPAKLLSEAAAPLRLTLRSLVLFLRTGTYLQLPKLAVLPVLPTPASKFFRSCRPCERVSDEARTKLITSSLCPHWSLTLLDNSIIPSRNYSWLYLPTPPHTYTVAGQSQILFFCAQCLACFKCARKICYSPFCPICK